MKLFFSARNKVHCALFLLQPDSLTYSDPRVAKLEEHDLGNLQIGNPTPSPLSVPKIYYYVTARSVLKPTSLKKRYRRQDQINQSREYYTKENSPIEERAQ